MAILEGNGTTGELRRRAALFRQVASIPTNGGHRADVTLLTLAGKYERDAEALEGRATAALVAVPALDTSAVGGGVPPDLAALELAPEPPVVVDRVAIAVAAFEALSRKERSQFLAALRPAGYRVERK